MNIELPKSAENAINSLAQISGKTPEYIVVLALEMLLTDTIEKVKKLKIDKIMC